MSEIRANTISDAAGTGPVTLTKQSAAKAWVRMLTGTGTPSLGDSFNVSSVVDGGAGQYTFPLTSSMSTANYGHVISVDVSGAIFGGFSSSEATASQLSLRSYNSSGTLTDTNQGSVAAHGDLA